MLRKLTAYAVAASLALGSGLAAPAQASDRNDDLLKALAAAAVIGLIIKNANDDKAAPPPRQGTGPRRISIPYACRTDMQTPQGWRMYYVRSCVQRAGVPPLPPACLRDIRTRDGWRAAYVGKCLASRGYKIEAR